jgi:hypothetical protein
MTDQMEFLLQIVDQKYNHTIHHSIQKIMTQAWELGSITYNIQDAIEWAGGFEFPRDIGDKDTNDLIRNGTFNNLCKERHDQIATQRLSVERVEKVVTEKRLQCFDGAKDKERLLIIARDGMHIPISNNFIPSNEPPKMRKKYVLVKSAVNKIIHGMYEKGGLVIILPSAIAKSIPGIHYSSTHWTTKKDKASGRVLGDQSNDPSGNALNDVEKVVQEQVREMWGAINHPTIHDLVNLIIRNASKYGWEQIILWKMDLKGAFGLLRIRTTDIPKFAFELSNDLTLIHTAGMFGWTGTPFAFSVVSRILEGCINSEIKGGLCVYVDDLCGCSGLKHATTDQETAKGICTQLLGEEALAEDKHFQGRRLDMLGWSFDLDLRTVSISEINHLKTLYCMFSLDTSKKQYIKTWQAIASRASRYSVVCEHMKPFTSAFHKMVASYKGSTSVAKIITQDAQLDLDMWKAFLCLLVPLENKFARQLDSFCKPAATVKIEYDASLTGIGYVLSVGKEESTWEIISFLGMDFPFQEDTKNDSSFQNTCEFLAVVASLVCLWSMGYRRFSYVLIGDNISSLSWCEKGKANSIYARNATVAFSLLSIQMHSTLHSTIHIPGGSNTTCDSLSRKEKRDSIHINEQLRSSDNVLNMIVHIFKLINPILCVNSQIGAKRIWQELLEFLNDGQADLNL